MTREEEIIEAAITRAERHQIAEMELHKGNNQLYFYDRIYNAEIASFEAGAKWADKNSQDKWISVEEDLPYYHKELITEDGVTTLPVPIIDHDGFPRLSNMVKCGTTWVWEEGVNPQYWLNIPKFPSKPKEISMTKEEQKQKAIALVEAYFNGTNILMKDPYAGIKDWTTIHNPSIWSYLGKFCENVDKYKII